MTDEKEASGKQVIARATSILLALEGFPAGASIGELSKASGLPRTTVHRLVGSLEAQQLLISDANGVRLGPTLVRLAASAHKDVVAIARPFIESLGRRTRETVDLCVYRGTHSVSVAQFASDQELRVVSAVGTAFPIHCTAHGKALLSTLDDEEVRGTLIGLIDQRTVNTETNVDLILATCHRARQDGFALDIEEHAKGVSGIGVALKTGLHERYAIALAVPSTRFKERKETLMAALMQCRAEIESVLGA
jgi:DNA-binding IclR family transcriptional regulator